MRGTVYGIVLIIVQGGACERGCVRDSVDNCTGWGFDRDCVRDVVAVIESRVVRRVELRNTTLLLH